jgi:SulP family sulfate permease
MPDRFHEPTQPSITEIIDSPRPKLGHALREKWKEGYRWNDFRADLMSGLVVAMVAIPLGMALAIASGVAPQNGLYTVIIGGIIVALLGGSRFQVSGPTAAFVVILAPIATKYGVGGLLTAGLMAGMIILGLGIARMGKLIQFIPYPVTTGFTSGIAVVIATMQLKDFFGLKIDSMPDHYLQKVLTLIQAAPTVSYADLGIGTLTLVLLWLWPKLNKKIPAPLVVLTLVSVVAIFLTKHANIFVDTIGSRFSYTVDGIMGQGIPRMLPRFGMPWLFGTEHFSISIESIQMLFLPAFAIAMLAAIESLLSAVVADGLGRTKHDPDAELIGLGIGNIICPFFGGIAATGAIARTATNIRYGAKSPLSSVMHGFVTLLVILLFAPYVSYLPMASLSALLIVVAYNMSERQHFAHILQVGPKSDVAVLLLCFLFTVIFDMVLGVSIGVMIAALLFMKRMAAVTSTQIIDPKSTAHNIQVPAEVLLYDINGPLFFGAAEKAIKTIESIQTNIKVVFLLLEDVPAMDVTGLVALETTIENLMNHKKKVYLIGVKTQPKQLILRSLVISQAKNLFFCKTIDYAIKHYQDPQDKTQ